MGMMSGCPKANGGGGCCGSRV
jgi:hypothetical protein